MSDAVSRKSRRNFLLAAAAGGAATAAAVVAQKSPTATTPGKSKRAGAGYAESTHIRNYYRTAKV